MSRGMPRPYNCCDPNINSSIYRKTKVQQLRFFLPHSKSKQSPPTNLSCPLRSQALIKNQPFYPIPKASYHHQPTFPARWEAKLSSKNNLSTLPESQAAAETSLDKGVEGKLSRKAYSKERLKGKLRTIARPKMGVEAKVTYESYLI